MNLASMVRNLAVFGGLAAVAGGLWLGCGLWAALVAVGVVLFLGGVWSLWR